MKHLDRTLLFLAILLLFTLAFIFGELKGHADEQALDPPAVTAMNRIADECYLYAQEKK